MWAWSGILVLVDMLDFNQETIDLFFPRSLHKTLSISISLQLYLGWSTFSRIYTFVFFSVTQTLKDAENIYKGTTGFDMSYDGSKDLCREAWKDEDYNYFYLDRFELKTDIVVVRRARKTYWINTRNKSVLDNLN